MRRPAVRTVNRPGLGRGALAAAFALAFALLLAGCGPPLGTVEHRVPGNLLSPETPVDSWGAIREQRLVDGKIPPPEAPVDDFVASLFLVPGARVTYDLGRPTRIAAVRLFSDDATSDCLWCSTDGKRFAPVRLGPPAGRGMIRSRHATGLALTARYLRIQPAADVGGKAFAELLVFGDEAGVLERRPIFCDPPTWTDAIRDVQGQVRVLDRIRIGVGIAAIVLLILAGRLSRRHRAAVSWAMILVGIAAGARFGWFHGNGKILHPADEMQYYLGAKYFDELGYRELYRAIAAWERQRGRGFMLDRELVRDLDDNTIHPGAWTATPDGACRAVFTADRWAEFGRDVDFFRRLFVYRDFHRSLRDHGYNATPFHTAWLGAAVRAIPATRESMLAWAGVDMLAYLAALAAILWAFGAPAAAVAALLFGLGDPWSFSWTGGSIARTVWLAVFCWGWTLLRRRHPVAGTAMLTVSAMLRLFPAVFVAAVGLFALLRRRKDGERGCMEFARVAGSAVVTLALGVGAVGLTHGMGAFSAFGDKALLHASVPPGNHLGLRALVLPGGSDHPYVAPGDATAPEPTRAGSFGRTAGLLAWILGVVVALALLLRRARRATASWEALPYAAPLLFASIPLSGYDYVWLAVLAPLAAVAPIRLTLLVGLAAATTALGQLLVGLRPTYLACNVLITGVLIAFFRPRGRPWPFRRPERGR